MKYHQLTAADRGAIEVLLHKHYTQKEIAKILGIHSSTVSREIKKRSTPNGYFAKTAQLHYERERKKCVKQHKLNNSKIQKYVVSRLEEGWSPEQIAGRLKRFNPCLYVCKETIYQWLYTDEWAYKEEKLYQYLRYGRKKRRKKGKRKVHRTTIPNRISIHARPKIVGERKEFGHAEGDSVIYPKKYIINTINDLATGLAVFTKLPNKTAKLTALAMSRRAKELGLKTITLDNGSEFTFHEQIGIPTYFADPYNSGQRGANENLNGLLRRYLPRGYDISNLTQEELDDIAEELNNRPRKRLNYLTPKEAYKILKQGG